MYSSRSISSATSESSSWHRRSDRRHTSETSPRVYNTDRNTPKTRNVLRRRPSGSAKHSKARDRAMPTPSRPNDPVPPLPPQDPISVALTPAGALVEAYKQQELCRDIPTPPNLSTHHRKFSTPSFDGRLAHLPHSSLHRDRWDHSSSHHPSMSDPGGSTLPRKLSTRWRRIRRDDSPKGHSKGRPSLHSLWESTTRPTGQSIDGIRDAECSSPIPGTGTDKVDKNEGGTKLWRLMRRISTGGLRDRFQSDKVVPPVPAIPKELLQKANQAHRPSSSSSHHKSPSAPKPIPVARPSVATSSSSPNSSDVASTRFFQKTHSARSSVSSYGEAVAASRTPDTVLRHIITPREQLRLGDDHSSHHSISVPTGSGTDDLEADHIPLPFAHRQCSGDSFSATSSRPPSASASVHGSARGSFHSPGRMVDGIVSLSPPPRTSKASRRGGSGSVASSPSQSMVIGAGSIRQMDRMPSSQSDMTARVASPESRRSQTRDPSRAMFRELDVARKPPLSEREKADIWNELLARSDEAGGTLHIHGTSELMSDTMRLSTLSEWS